jgi:hypothetical protein
MSDTPETDALYMDDHRPNLMDHARRLERERDQLRAINAELLVALDVVLNDWQYGLEIHQADSYYIAREVLTKAKAIKS